jgi:hypothetical protein
MGLASSSDNRQPGEGLFVQKISQYNAVSWGCTSESARHLKLE